MVRTLTWLKVKEVAKILNLTDSAIKKAIKKNKYEYRHVEGIGRGGVRIEIALESLPQEAQDKYNNVQKEQAHNDMMQFTGKQREEANFKALIVENYQKSQRSPDDYIKDFNERNPDSMITKSQLFRWQRKYKNGDIAVLVDMRGGHKLTTALPPVANMIPTASKRLKTGYTIFAAESASLPRYLEMKIPSTMV